MTDGTTTWEYTYDANGMRTSRSNGTEAFRYVYNGGQLSQMTVGGNTLTFTYDVNGTPAAVTYNGTVYYYITTLQGDVLMILNVACDVVVEYTYDAWGRVLSTTGSMASTLGQLNPLRYRGYVYDNETELYYLQSRYYDPEVGRFINADAIISSSLDILGNNMLAYCLNNPVNRDDEGGDYSVWALLGQLHDWGFVHRMVQAHIAANYPSITTEFTGLDVGRADIVQGCFVWEIKHAGTQPLLRTAMAMLQAYGYTLVSKEQLYLGAANTFHGEFYISVLGYSFLVAYTTPAAGAILYTVTATENYSGEYFEVLGVIPEEVRDMLKFVRVCVATGLVVSLFGEGYPNILLSRHDLAIA